MKLVLCKKMSKIVWKEFTEKVISFLLLILLHRMSVILTNSGDDSVASSLFLFHSLSIHLNFISIEIAKHQPILETFWPLQWRSYGRDGASNHRRIECLLNRLFRHKSKKIPKLRVTSLCEENSPLTGEFPTQRTSYVENVSIWWRNHDSLIAFHPTLNDWSTYSSMLGFKRIHTISSDMTRMRGIRDMKMLSHPKVRGMQLLIHAL